MSFYDLMVIVGSSYFCMRAVWDFFLTALIYCLCSEKQKGSISMLVSKLFRVSSLIPKIPMSRTACMVQLLSQYKNRLTVFLVGHLYTNPYRDRAYISILVRESLLQVGWEFCSQLGLAGHLGWGGHSMYLFVLLQGPAG